MNKNSNVDAQFYVEEALLQPVKSSNNLSFHLNENKGHPNKAVGIRVKKKVST